MSLDLARFHKTFFEGEPPRFASLSRCGGERLVAEGNRAGLSENEVESRSTP